MKLQKRHFSAIPFIALALLLGACNGKKEEKKAEVKKLQLVKTQVIGKQLIARSVDFSSTLEPAEQVDLVPTAPGRIQKISVEMGSRVKKGQLLVEMDQTNLYNARVQLANQKTEYNRMKILIQTGSVSQQVYDQTKAQYDVAQSSVDNLENNTMIRAPFSGIISGKYLDAGEMYSGSPTTSTGKAAIVSIVQISTLKAMINVPETYYPLVKVGMKTDIKCDIFPSKSFKGQVTRLAPTIDVNTHSFQVELKVPNAGETLKPGMYCRANLDLGKVDALMVPYQAVLKTQGSNERYVFLNEGGLAKRVVVTLGQRFNDQVEIISNEISEGKELIVEGQGRLVVGDKLKVLK